MKQIIKKVTKTVTTTTEKVSQSDFACMGTINLANHQLAAVPEFVHPVPAFEWMGRLAYTTQGNLMFVPERRNHGSSAIDLKKVRRLGAARVLKNGRVRVTLTIDPNEDNYDDEICRLEDGFEAIIDFFDAHKRRTLDIVNEQKLLSYE